MASWLFEDWNLKRIYLSIHEARRCYWFEILGRETYTSTLNKIFYWNKPQFRLFPSFIFFKITTHLHLDVNFENVGNFLFIHQQELLNFDSNETFNPSIILKRQKKKKSGTINNNTDLHINYNTRLTPSPSLCRLTTDNGQDSRFHRASPSNSPSVSRACNSSSILVGVEWSGVEKKWLEYGTSLYGTGKHRGKTLFSHVLVPIRCSPRNPPHS